MEQAPAVWEKHSKAMVALCLRYIRAGLAEKDEDTAAPAPGGGGKAWRDGLKGWLGAVAAFGGIRGAYKAAELRELLVALLKDADPTVQQAALRCLERFKLAHLQPYLARLQGLVPLTRQGMERLPLAADAEDGVLEAHRAGFVPVLLRLLYPSIRKRKQRLTAKASKASARAVVLNYLAALRTAELRPLLELVLEPVVADLARTGASMREVARWLDADGDAAPAATAGVVAAMGVVGEADARKVASRRSLGFLNMFEDLATHLGYHLLPYLHVPLHLLLQIALAACRDGGAAEEGGGGDDGAAADEGGWERREGQGGVTPKALRAASLNTLTDLVSRFDEYAWEPFAPAVRRLLHRALPAVAAQCTANPPPALQLVFALCQREGPAAVLRDEGEDDGGGGGGFRSLACVVDVLQAPRASPQCKALAISIFEAVVGLEPPLMEELMLPVADGFLAACRAHLAEAPGAEELGHRALARELAVLEALTPYPRLFAAPADLVDALCLVLERPPGKGRARAGVVSRALATLGGIWRHQAAAGEAQDEDLARLLRVFGGLFGKVKDAQARVELCAAFEGMGAAFPRPP